MCNKKIIGIIPARLDSRRFPEKLLAKLKGKSVLQRTFEQAKKCTALTDLFIATDSDKIIRHMQDMDAAILKTSSFPTSGTERIVEAMDKYPELKEAEVIFNLQGDHPFTSSSTIEKITDLFQQDPDLLVATAAVRLQKPQAIFSPHIVKCVLDKYNNALYFSRSPIPYPTTHLAQYPCYHHIGIYAYRPSFLQQLPSLEKSSLEVVENLEQLRFLENGIKIRVAVVEDLPYGIDTPQDLKQCEQWVCS